MSSQTSTRTIRRIAAAEGYLELGMAHHALDELGGIDKPGPFEGAKQYLTGEALMAQERYAEAIKSLRRAAQIVPAPQNGRVWQSLSECFRENGQTELADAAERRARTLKQAEKTITRIEKAARVPKYVLRIIIERR